MGKVITQNRSMVTTYLDLLMANRFLEKEKVC